MAFEDTGVRSELAEAARAVGYDNPTPLQEAAIPVIRRGSNVLLRASAGAGVVAAYTLGLLDRVVEEDATTGDALRPAVLALAPDDHAASLVAESAGRFARVVDLRVRALAPGWDLDAGADFLVATPDAALAAVQTSRLKLDGLLALVLDGAGVMLDLAAEALETVTTTVPGPAQRIVVGDPDVVGDFVERHARRALTFPPTPPEEEPAPFETAVRFAAVPASRKAEVAVRVLVAAGGGTVICPTAAEADRVASSLSVRGFDGTVVPPDGETDGFVLSWSPPFDADELARRHASGGAVLARPRELPHLRRIAADAGASLEPIPEPPAEASALRAFRDAIRDAARTGDLAAQLLVLEPLLEELSMAEVAAAAAHLARRRVPEAAAPTPAPESRARAPAPEQAFTRLFISAGERDNVRPGDIVGAITGEANVSGDKVGKIEIADTHTLVEVDRDVAERVIRALNGTSLRGRSLRVDFDRKGGRRSPRRRS